MAQMCFQAHGQRLIGTESKGWRHIINCSGPAQLAFVLAALEVWGIERKTVALHPIGGEYLNQMIVALAREFDIEVFCERELLSPRSLDYWMPRHLRRSRVKVAWWYSRGHFPILGSIAAWCRSLAPKAIIEYYDGFRSPIVAAKTSRLNLLGLLKVDPLRGLKRVYDEEQVRPDLYVMRDDKMWRTYAHARARARTHFVRPDVVISHLERVGEVLFRLTKDESWIGFSPRIVILAGRFAEYGNPRFSIDDETNMYTDLLHSVREVSADTRILVKAHPRTSGQKAEHLKAACSRFGARLTSGRQLAEYILQKEPGRHRILLAPPSSTLVNAHEFDLARCFCLGEALITSYVGRDYTSHQLFMEDHAIMADAGVTSLNSLEELKGAVQELLHGERESRQGSCSVK